MHSLQLACALGLLAQGHSLNLALAVQGLQNDAATEARNAALLGRARPRPRPPAAAPPETWSKQAVFATTPQLPALSDTSGKPCAAGRLPPPTRMACGVLWYVHVTKAGGKGRRGRPRRLDARRASLRRHERRAVPRKRLRGRRIRGPPGQPADREQALQRAAALPRRARAARLQGCGVGAPRRAAAWNV